MDEEETRKVISESIAAEFEKHSPMACAIGLDKEQHDKDHRFVAYLVEIFNKLDKVKWGFFGGAIRSIGAIAVLALAIGLVVLAKAKLTNFS